MPKYTLSTTEIKWIISALNLHIANVKAEMEAVEDGSPIYAIGECVVDGREELVIKLTDIINDKTKQIKII